ncbi:MAG: PPOX class F420-dependent oxidoreductase [Acidimicrobiales bacterium]
MVESRAVFTDDELAYLQSQRLGRLATVDADGAPQNNPVGLHVNTNLGTIDVMGFNLSSSRKFHNVLSNPHVAMVVDDLVSVDPWVVRGIEVRGDAEAVADSDPPVERMGREVIRIHPRRVISWGISPDRTGMKSRAVGPTS